MVDTFDPTKTEPQAGREIGSMFDYRAGDLVFSIAPPGAPDGVFEVGEWREPDALQIMEMLGNEGKARSLQQVLTLPIRKAEWKITSKDGKNEEMAQWVDDMLRASSVDNGMKTPMDDVIAQKTGAFAFRRAYHEKVWKRQGSFITYDKIAWRPPDTCVLLRNKGTGELVGFSQWVFEKVDKQAILFPYASVYIHGHDADPVKGYSDLQVCYRNYRTKEKIKFLWYTYLECLSLPRTILLANSDDGAKKAVQAVAALKNAGVAGVPKDWVSEIKTIDVGGGGTGNQQFRDALAYLDSDSALSLLAGFTDLPARASAGAGSNALSADQSEMFMDMMNAYAKELATNMTTDIVQPLVRYNYGSQAPVPQFEFEDLNPKDTSDAFAMLTTLATGQGATLIPDEFVMELVTSVANDLGLDVNAIEKGIKAKVAQLKQQAKSQQEAQMAQTNAAADVGAQAVQGAQQGQGGQNGA